jgi:hypothetical protein
MKPLLQAGDTIVEVLISIAILTLVLGGAYYTADRSYRNDQDSNEHTEALTIAESQVESLTASTSGYLFYQSGGQCLSSTLTVEGIGDNACYIPSNNTSTILPTNTGSAPFNYVVNISLLNGHPITVDSVSLYTYKIGVSWPAIGGGTDYVSLYYRVDGS